MHLMTAWESFQLVSLGLCHKQMIDLTHYQEVDQLKEKHGATPVPVSLSPNELPSQSKDTAIRYDTDNLPKARDQISHWARPNSFKKNFFFLWNTLLGKTAYYTHALKCIRKGEDTNEQVCSDTWLSEHTKEPSFPPLPRSKAKFFTTHLSCI